MGNIGFGELMLILVVLLLVFGSSKLPQLGDALGRSIKNFKKSVSGDDSIDVTPKKLDEGAPPPPAASASTTQPTSAADTKR
jgi:sec-independent protein translocase protein TatA